MYYISKKSCHSAIDYAAEELKKYLHMMMPESGYSEIVGDSENKDGFRLGLMQDFGLDVSDAQDTELDDILYIETTEKGGIIAGDNPRSVLLAVYEYLRQNGCRWLFPGIDGEFIPMKDITPVKYRHMASMRFRGWCNEGAESQQSLLDMIEFSPKAGLNVCMQQFRIPTVFYDRYYEHQNNIEHRFCESVTWNQMLQWTRQGEAEIKKRGLQLHGVGHGLFMDAFNISSAYTWAKVSDEKVPDDVRQYLAQVGGVRKLFVDSPGNTNFCMSNPEARRRTAEFIADYAENHSNLDYLHIWLADNYNNQCECEECRKKRPSDWYIIWLNEIDEIMTRRGLDNKLAFIAYVDLNWAPLTEQLNNPGRFIFASGPSTRTRTMTLSNDPKDAGIPPYERNKIELPKTLDAFFSHFKEWERIWNGTKYAFEYHFWGDIHFDLSQFEMAERIYEDLRAYKNHGFDGLVYFISTRHFFPNGYGFYANARMLFDMNVTPEDVKADYFPVAYGEHCGEVLELFDRIRDVFDYRYMCGKNGISNRKYYNPEIAEKLKASEELSQKALEISEKMPNPAPRVQSAGKKLLYYFGIYIRELGEFLEIKASGDCLKAKERFEEFREYFGQFEAEINDYYDHYMVTKIMRLISWDIEEMIQ